MAGTPRYKIYNSQNQYIAATKHIEDGAALCSFNGTGSTIRDGHTKADTVWQEGHEDFPAGESYDRVVLLVHERQQKRSHEAMKRNYGVVTPEGFITKGPLS